MSEYEYDPNDTVDCSPLQEKKKRERLHKTLNHRSRHKLHLENNINKCCIDQNTSNSIFKENLTCFELELKGQCDDDEDASNFNILAEVCAMSKAERLPCIKVSENRNYNDSEIFLTASQFRDKIVSSNDAEAQSDKPKMEILEMSNKLVSPVKANKNYISHLNENCKKFPKSEFYVDIYKDFTELEDDNCLSTNESNLSPPPFRYKRKYLRTYNGPNFQEKLTSISKTSVENKINSKGDMTSEPNSTKLSYLNSQQLNSSNVQDSQNISKNILNLSFIHMSPNNFLIDSLNFEDQNSLESEENTDFNIKKNEQGSLTLISKQLFESIDDEDELEISNLEDEILININNSNEDVNQVIEMRTPLRLSQSLNEVKKYKLKDSEIRKTLNCNIEKPISKTEIKMENLSLSNTPVENIPPTRKSLRLANSKSKRNKYNKTDDTQDSEYLTPIGQFLNESNHRQLRIREKINQISFILNENEDSDDEDFRGFDLNNLSPPEDEEFYQNYKRSTQNMINKYLEEDLEVFEAIDESHCTISNIIKQGETQSLLNDSFMDCPNVLRDVDILLNKNKLDQPEQCNKINNIFDSELWPDDDIFNNIKTQNFVNCSGNNYAGMIEENLNKNYDVNFKTPTRPPSKSNFNDLQTLHVKTVDSGELISIPMLEGFKTGNGKPITISSEALKKASNFITETFNEEDLEESADRQLFGKSLNLQPSQKTLEKESDFQMKKKMGESVRISDVGFNNSDNFRTDVPKLEGFKYGNGKPIKISSQSYKKAAAFMTNAFDEIEASASVEKPFDDHPNNQVPDNCSSFSKRNRLQIKNKVSKPDSFSGFRFVTGTTVLHSEAKKTEEANLAKTYSEESPKLAAAFNKLDGIKVLSSVKENKNSMSGNDVNLNFYDDQTKAEIICDETTSKRKIEDTYGLPGKVFKYDSIENSVRKQQLDDCTEIHANYELALSIGRPSTSKLYSNKVIPLNTPKTTGLKINLNKTPSTPLNNENSSKISTPNLADFYSSIVNNNKSTPQPGLSPLTSKDKFFDDLMPLNDTTNSDIDYSKNGSITTPNRSGPSPKMRIEYLKQMHPNPPELSPGFFINNCKPSGLRKRSRLTFSKAKSNR